MKLSMNQVDYAVYALMIMRENPNMEEYEKPRMEAVEFSEDVIQTSGHHGCCSGSAYAIELPELP